MWITQQFVRKWFPAFWLVLLRKTWSWVINLRPGFEWLRTSHHSGKAIFLTTMFHKIVATTLQVEILTLTLVWSIQISLMSLSTFSTIISTFMHVSRFQRHQTFWNQLRLPMWASGHEFGVTVCPIVGNTRGKGSRHHGWSPRDLGLNGCTPATADIRCSSWRQYHIITLQQPCKLRF